jgi:peptidoglycan/LPS O-acetylase OafA/YrhL
MFSRNYPASTPYQQLMTTDRPRLPALTSLRFFAALHVFVFHMYAMQIANTSGWARRVSSIGYVGVSFFFILSGFILVYTYDVRPISAREFWRARFARIYPAYLFSLLFTAPFFFYVSIKLKPAPIPFMIWPQNHLITSCLLVPSLIQSWIPGAALAWNPPAWSLSDEAFFYLLFPALIVWLARKRTRTWMQLALLCWAVSLAITLLYVWRKPDGVAFVDDNSANLNWLTTLKFNPLVRFPEFLLGACCGFLFLRGTVDRKWATPMIFTGLAYFVFIVALAPRIPYPILHDAALTPAFVSIIYGMALRPPWTMVLEIPPLVLLGEASYSFYLLHSNMLGWIFQPTGEPLHPSFGKMILGVTIPILVSILVYKLIEEPARRVLRGKKKLVSQLTPAAATA